MTKRWGILLASDNKFYQAVEKVIFSQTRSWANKSKILSAGLPRADRSVFEK